MSAAPMTELTVDRNLLERASIDLEAAWSALNELNDRRETDILNQIDETAYRLHCLLHGEAPQDVDDLTEHPPFAQWQREADALVERLFGDEDAKSLAEHRELPKTLVELHAQVDQIREGVAMIGAGIAERSDA
jgi:hypothetical protein